MNPEVQAIYDRYNADRQAHRPCEACAKARRREEMCQAGEALYLRMLGELDEVFTREDAAKTSR